MKEPGERELGLSPGLGSGVSRSSEGIEDRRYALRGTFWWAFLAYLCGGFREGLGIQRGGIGTCQTATIAHRLRFDKQFPNNEGAKIVFLEVRGGA